MIENKKLKAITPIDVAISADRIFVQREAERN
jgi:hypothetical protein